MTIEDKETIMKSKTFVSFFDRTSKMVEKYMDEG